MSVTADENVVSPYPKDPWGLVPNEPPPPSSPMLRAAADPAHGPQPADPAEPFSAPVTPASEPLSRAVTAEPPASGSSTGSALGERPAPGGGAFGERRSGERPAAAGAFGEPSHGSGLGAFADRPPPSGGGAFGDRPKPSASAFGEPAATPPPAVSAPGEQVVSDDTDSFTFGSFAEDPRETGTAWLPPGPLTPGGDTGTYRAPEPGTSGATGDQAVRGWLEAALPASRSETRPDETRPVEKPAAEQTAGPGEERPAEDDQEQERFNKFASGGSDTEAVVVPREAATARVERPTLSDPLALRDPLAPAEKAFTPPAAEPVTPAPAAEPPAPPASSASSAPPGLGVRERETAPEKEKEEREPYRPRRGRPAPTPGPQPAFGTSSRRGGPVKGLGEVRQTADSLDPVSLLRGRRNAPAGGWRKLVFKASAGLIKPGESPEVRRRRELLSRARTPVATGHHRVAVLSLKGGVGKTTTTVGLGATLASVRGDRVIAVDANPDRGTLSDKVELETSATVRDLLNERQQIKRYVDIRAFTSQSPSRLEILASDRDPSVSEAFSSADYQSVAQVLENFYSICITDCGTGLLHSAMSGVLGLADQLVLVSSPSVDGARAASATLDWLEAHHYGDLVKAATVVLCSVRPRSKSTVDLDRLEAHFAARCRAVIRVPYDPHLEEGAEIDLDRLLPATRESYLLLAASVGDGFGGTSV
ncbi:MinD/ParA family ATP-binding protein [Sphaerisporangium aureirubrum]|uniref:AAA family ATPase n=1 Tax=Sphaerisporangium aureirubrum TaxID=1544736 RepID=A0ABW1NV91_9ACTN